eukprot:tig00021348_g20586.t1
MAARGIRRVVFSTGSGLQWASAKVADLLQDPSVRSSYQTALCRADMRLKTPAKRGPTDRIPPRSLRRTGGSELLKPPAT